MDTMQVKLKLSTNATHYPALKRDALPIHSRRIHRDPNHSPLVPPPSHHASSVITAFVNRVKSFLSNRTKKHRIVVVTSGGTAVQLEKRTVRYLDNFSTGLRGSCSAEEFLEQDEECIVIFFSREGSLQPYSRVAQSGLVSKGFEGLFSDDTPTVDARILNAYTSFQKSKDRLFIYHFFSFNEYLWGLTELAVYLSTYGSRVVFYLAAAVSDFCVDMNTVMPEHKISSTADGRLEFPSLMKTPKVVARVRHFCGDAFIVAFKLETDENLLHRKAEALLNEKDANLVIGNFLHSRDTTAMVFGYEESVLECRGRHKRIPGVGTPSTWKCGKLNIDGLAVEIMTSDLVRLDGVYAQRRIRLLRSIFNAWEYGALQRVYERQRRVLTAETALRILDIKKALAVWLYLSELHKRSRHVIRIDPSRLANALHLWKQVTLLSVKVVPPTSLDSLIARYHCLSAKGHNPRSRVVLSINPTKESTPYSLTLALHGLIAFIKAHQDAKKTTNNDSKTIHTPQPTLMAHVRVAYATWGVKISPCHLRLLYALDFLPVVWPVHYGALWNRHVAIAQLLRSALLQFRLRSWYFHVKTVKELRKRSILLCYRVWMSFTLNQRRKKSYLSLVTFTLVESLSKCSIRRHWTQWRLMLFKAIQLRRLVNQAIHGRRKKQLSDACLTWRVGTEKRKALNVRVVFLINKWTIVVGLWHWRHIAKFSAQRRFLIQALYEKHRLRDLWRLFQRFQTAFRLSMQVKATARVLQHMQLRQCLRLWKTHFEKRMLCLKTISFTLHNRIVGTIRAWRHSTCYSLRLKNYCTHQTLVYLSKSILEWKAAIRSIVKLTEHKFSLQRAQQLGLCRRPFNAWISFFKRRWGCREACRKLEIHLVLWFAMARWSYALSCQLIKEQNVMEIIQRFNSIRCLGIWKSACCQFKRARVVRITIETVMRNRYIKQCNVCIMTWKICVSKKGETRNRCMVVGSTAFFWTALRYGIGHTTTALKRFEQRNCLSACKDARTNAHHVMYAKSTTCFSTEDVFFAFWLKLPRPIRELVWNRICRIKRQLVTVVRSWKRKTKVSRHYQAFQHIALSLNSRTVHRCLEIWTHYIHFVKQRRILIRQINTKCVVRCWNSWEYNFFQKLRDNFIMEKLQKEHDQSLLFQAWNHWRILFSKLQQ